MKILLFLNYDIHSATALSLLSSTLKNHQTKIILSKKVGNISALAPELIEFKKHEQTGIEPIFAKLAANLNAEISSYENVNSPDALQDFQNFAPDLIISIRFGQIFKQPLINIPRHGVLNLHSALLPNYRGILGTFWSILHGAEKIGTTLHFINDASIDTGDIVEFSAEKIDWNSSLLLNINNLYKAGCINISQSLEKIAVGEKIITKNQSQFGQGSYFSYPKPEDIKKFLTIMPLAKSQDVTQILQIFSD